jgi:hypothetical protein
MVRCLLGAFVLTVGLIALASTNRETAAEKEESASRRGSRLRESEASAQSGASRTLLRPLPTWNMAFSLN